MSVVLEGPSRILDQNRFQGLMMTFEVKGGLNGLVHMSADDLYELVRDGVNQIDGAEQREATRAYVTMLLAKIRLCRFYLDEPNSSSLGSQAPGVLDVLVELVKWDVGRGLGEALRAFCGKAEWAKLEEILNGSGVYGPKVFLHSTPVRLRKDLILRPKGYQLFPPSVVWSVNHV